MMASLAVLSDGCPSQGYSVLVLRLESLGNEFVGLRRCSTRTSLLIERGLYLSGLSCFVVTIQIVKF